MFNRIVYPLLITVGMLIHFLLWKFSTLPISILPSATFLSFLLIVIFFEKFHPYKKEWNESVGDFKADILTTLFILPLITKSIEKAELYFNDTYLRFEWGDHLPFWAQFIVVLFVSEFLFYWYHRISHKQKWLLRFHSVHHGHNRLYWGNSGNFHFMDILIQFTFYFIPLYIFRASPEVTALLLTLTVVTGILLHANIMYETKYLSYIFNTGELHHLHHSPNINISNKNFGKVTSLFDLMFGTFIKSEEERSVLKPGLPFNKKMPVDLIGQWKFPFKKSKK